MNVKMYNQLYTTKYADGRYYEEWTTTYITDIAMEKSTKEVKTKVEAFIKRYFSDKNPYMESLQLERNCPLGLWQFTIATYEEVTDFEIDE